MTRLGPLAHLDFDHLDLRFDSLLGELFGIESAIVRAAAEIAAAKFPDQVATALPVIARNAAFPGVVIETACLGALVQSQNGIAGE